jgi:hypothetical protein
MVHYRVHKSPPQVSIQSTLLHPIYLISILILSSYLHLGIPSGLFLLSLPPKTLYTSKFFPMRTIFSAHRILLIILIILGEEYKLWSSTVCSFLQPPVTYSFFGPYILLSTLISNTNSLYFSLMSQTKFHTHTKLQETVFFLFLYLDGLCSQACSHSE